MGLVNIITYSNEQQLFTRVEGNGALSGGVMGSYSNESNQLQVHANLYGFDNNSADAPNSISADEERQSVYFHSSTMAFHCRLSLFTEILIRAIRITWII